MLKIINGNNKINKYSTYKIIPVGDSNGCLTTNGLSSILPGDVKEFSSVVFFPVANLASEVDLTTYK